MAKRQSRPNRAKRQRATNPSRLDALRAVVDANHGELVELRHTSEVNFRRIAELQVEVDRLKKLLAGV